MQCSTKGIAMDMYPICNQVIAVVQLLLLCWSNLLFPTAVLYSFADMAM